MADTPKAALKRRIKKILADRDMRAPFINEVYRLGMPHRDRIGATKSTPMSEDEIQDILDTTFAETIDDFASDMIAEFTPFYEPWVRHVPTKALKPEVQRQIADQITGAVNWFWEDMANSNYYDAADECFHELAAGTMAVRIRDYGAAQPICYEPIPTARLLVDAGPDRAPDFRGTQGKIEKRMIQAIYGHWIDWKNLPKELAMRFNNAREDQMFEVTDGIHRLFDQPGITQWRRVVMMDGEIIYERFFNEDGAEDVMVARWRTESNSAFGIGAGWWACAPSRVLNELNALVLAQMHNSVDPAHAFSDPDGTANLEQGIGAGDYLQLGEGFNIQKLNGDGEFQAAFYSREDLRMMIKSALYQDKPFQRGDTPPSATQWADESARAQQRWEIPRGKITREWTVPIVRAHQHLRTKHGLFPPIQTKGGPVSLQPQSPQAKARSFEKVTKAERVLMTSAQPALQQTAMLAIDGRATLANIKAEIGDELVVVRSEEQMKALVQQAAAVAQEAEGMGE